MSDELSRPRIIAGNWKMYKTIEEAVSFIETLAPLIGKSQAAVYLAVPFTAIQPAVACVKKLKAKITIGAQNMSDAQEGAFTGEIAAKMLVEAGAQFVILGHSERRYLFHEGDAFINRKIKRALKTRLEPILCIGETLEERNDGQTEAILEGQLLGSLEGLSTDEVARVRLAYEPVWAIGTGKVASPKDAAVAHRFCRNVLSDHWEKGLGDKVAILYGGSAKPENAPDLLAQKDVDGLLIGGASLSAETFSEMIK